MALAGEDRGEARGAGADNADKTPVSTGIWGRLGVRTRFKLIDFVINCLLFTPLVVLFQVGAMGLHEFFLNYVPGPIGTALLLIQGIGIEFGCSLWQQQLTHVVRDREAEDAYYVIVTRLYHYAIAYANVCHYRGISDIYYALLGDGAFSAVQTTTTTILILSGIKCARNVLGPPLAVGVDSATPDFFETTTYFKTKRERSLSHMLDHASTVVGITSLCNLHWIATWALFDRIIFPENLAISVTASWIIGYSICAAAMLLEARAKQISRDLEKRNRNLKLIFEDAVLICANFGVILVWRGHWIFFESMGYYFPIYHNSVDMTPVYGNFSAFAMLCLCYVSGTAILKGCDIDGTYSDGEGISFCVDYFAEFFHDQMEEEEEEEKNKHKSKDRKEGEADMDKNYNYDAKPKRKYKQLVQYGKNPTIDHMISDVDTEESPKKTN